MLQEKRKLLLKKESLLNQLQVLLPKKGIISEGNEVANRFKKLAGLIK